MVYPLVDKVMYAELSAPLVFDDFDNVDEDPALNNDNAGWQLFVTCYDLYRYNIKPYLSRTIYSIDGATFLFSII